MASTEHDVRPLLRLGHSPDPDDAFMWWPITPDETGRTPMETGRFRFEVVLDDIESFNLRAERDGDLDLTAVSCAQYPRIRDRYAITHCGASMGERYGPKLISRQPRTLDELRASDVVIAVPGERTTAFLLTGLILGAGRFRHEAMPFDHVLDRMISGEFEAGLVIHEAQLTFEAAGFHLIQDVGAWWFEQTGCPLPLGLNVVRRDLDERFGSGTCREVAGLLEASVRFAMDHRAEAVRYALTFARGISEEIADRFVEMYVTSRSIDMGADGEEAIRRLLQDAHAAGLVPDPGEIDVVRPGGEAERVRPSGS